MPHVPPELAEMLSCPRCKGKLEACEEPAGFACGACRLLYPIVDGIPNFLVEEAKPMGLGK